MSDTQPRNPSGAAQMLADALLRSVTGTTAMLRIPGPTTNTNQTEVGIVATNFAQVALSPAVMRSLRPYARVQEGDQNRWELLVSATSVQQQINTLDLPSAQALFASAFAVNVAGQDYLIEAISTNEAFGQVYLYRLYLREARPQEL
jgi:hypothetical protein